MALNEFVMVQKISSPYFRLGWDLLRSVRCVFYGFGIILLLGIYGLLQERIMSVPYGIDYFQTSTFLVLLSRFIPIMVAFIALLVEGETMKPQAPFWQYFVVALSNVCSTTCSFEALKSISFPMQMLGKSFKMVPVMLWGRLLTGKIYSLMDWIVALVVTFGVIAFCLTGSVSAPQTDGSHVCIGLIILGVYLVFDGFTPTFQEKIFNKYQVSANNMILHTNISACIICAIGLVITGSLPISIKFCVDHPLFLLHAAAFSAVAMASQFCIYPMIQEHGALIFAMTMNIRQVVSILASYAIYSKPITVPQVLGLTVIFAALYYKAMSSEKEAGEKAAGEKALDVCEKRPLLAHLQDNDQSLDSSSESHGLLTHLQDDDDARNEKV